MSGSQVVEVTQCAGRKGEEEEEVEEVALGASAEGRGKGGAQATTGSTRAAERADDALRGERSTGGSKGERREAGGGRGGGVVWEAARQWVGCRRIERTQWERRWASGAVRGCVGPCARELGHTGAKWTSCVRVLCGRGVSILACAAQSGGRS